MKNRERQRANRRMKQEFLSMRNDMGIKDLTPYYAVKHMVEQVIVHEDGRVTVEFKSGTMVEV